MFVLPGNGCVDKDGAVKIACILCPGAKMICTCNEMGWDAVYSLGTDNFWHFNDLRSAPDTVLPGVGSMMNNPDFIVSEEHLVSQLVASGIYESLLDETADSLRHQVELPKSD